MTSSLLQIIGSPIIIIVATTTFVLIIAWLIINAILRVYAKQRDAATEVLVTNTQSPLIRAWLPTARMLGTAIGDLCGGSAAYKVFTDRLERELAGAGKPEGLSAPEFVGIGILQGLLWSAIVALFIVVISPEILFTTEGAFYTALGFGFGLISWKSWLNGKRQKRQTAIKRQLPFVLDLLTLAMEAGMDFTSALGRIVAKTGKTSFGTELSLMLHEIQLGKTRSDAMRDLSNRCDVPDLRTVVASLIQAEELGSSLGMVLRIQAAQQRERRGQTAEEKAMKAPVKMLLPMVLILAALFVMMGAPIALAYLENF